jgi:hypothetical protein
MSGKKMSDDEKLIALSYGGAAVAEKIEPEPDSNTDPYTNRDRCKLGALEELGEEPEGAEIISIVPPPPLEEIIEKTPEPKPVKQESKPHVIPLKVEQVAPLELENTAMQYFSIDYPPQEDSIHHTTGPLFATVYTLRKAKKELSNAEHIMKENSIDGHDDIAIIRCSKESRAEYIIIIEGDYCRHNDEPVSKIKGLTKEAEKKALAAIAKDAGRSIDMTWREFQKDDEKKTYYGRSKIDYSMLN